MQSKFALISCGLETRQAHPVQSPLPLTPSLSRARFTGMLTRLEHKFHARAVHGMVGSQALAIRTTSRTWGRIHNCLFRLLCDASLADIIRITATIPKRVRYSAPSDGLDVSKTA